MLMTAGTQFETDAEPEPRDTPDVSACTSSPEKTVLLESGNTDGWIASDLTVVVEE